MSRSSETAPAARRSDVEIAHFWMEGDGQGMLDAVLEGFASRHRDVDVATEFYANHGLAIKSRILKEVPPSVFVEWPGKNLEPYLEVEALLDLTDLWEETGLADAVLDGPTDWVTYDGRVRGIPVDIHRMNNLFYNVELTEQVGVDPERIDDPRELLRVAEQCADAGLVGLEQPMKNPWTVVMFWSAVLIGQFGAESFADIADGNPRSHRREIRTALELTDRFADLASDDANFLGMVGANQRFVDGESVFFYQGDWVAAEYDGVEGFDYGAEWDHVAFPGTEGVYRLGIDAVVASADAAGNDDVRTFLKYVSSPEALETLNREKGSIPPRRDVSMDRYPQFLRDQFEDFERATHFPAGHSLQVTPEAFVEVKTAISDFMVDRDVEAATDRLVEAYSLSRP